MTQTLCKNVSIFKKRRSLFIWSVLQYHFTSYSKVLEIFLGTDVSIVAHSLGVQKALEGAELLEKDGISCEV